MINATTQFAHDVEQGLSSVPKSLSSKYFYDEVGDALFVQIMAMPEYYLTDCEFEILSEKTLEIIESWQLPSESFSLIELGAGDGTKTIELLRALVDRDFEYIPIDISQNALHMLQERLNNELPWLDVRPKQGEYFKVLESLPKSNPKVVLFLGSNIGNLSDKLAAKFLEQLAAQMLPGDILLLGVDKKKSEKIVLPAYDDAQGYTREFNLNLLERMNRELGANFEVDQFEHVPEYDEEAGIARSALRSRADQEVYIENLDKSFQFEEDELIHTEISRKYNLSDVRKLIEGTGLTEVKIFTDKKQYFYNIVLRKGG